MKTPIAAKNSPAVGCLEVLSAELEILRANEQEIPL
jgi:hypothetical protein